MKVASSLLLGLLGTFSVSANANNKTLFELSLDELLSTTVETASKYSEHLRESPAINSIISKEEINGFGANNLLEVLERVVSVHMTGSNFFPQNVMSMRGDLLGHYDNHILLLLNGRPMRESYAGGVNFAIYTAFPLVNIERIEIIRGPGSVLYGTNAYAGVVNIISNKSLDKQLALTLGSFETKSLEIATQLNTEDLDITLGLKHFSEDGWAFKAYDNNQVFGQTDYGENNLGLFSDIRYEKLRANLFYARSRQDFIGASADWRSGPPIDQRTIASERLFADLSYEINLTHYWQLDSHLSYSDMNFDHYNYLAKAKDTSLELTSHYQPNSQWNWIVGATYWHQDVGSESRLANAPVPSFRANWSSIYSQLDYKPFENLKVIAGLQWNKADSLSAKTVSRFGFTYQFSDTTGIKIMRAQAYRAAFGVETGFSLILTNPDGSIRGGLRGNPTLNPEEITTTDAQIFYHSSHFQVSATHFKSQLSELVTRQRADDNVIDFINNGELDITGWELEGKYNLNEQWHVMASASYQNNETGTHVENYTTVPNHLIKIGVLYQSESGVSLGIFNNYVSEATDIKVRNPSRLDVNPDADAYGLVTAKLSLNLSRFKPEWQNIKLSLYGYNLTDQAIYQPDFIGTRINTLPARQGRSWYLALNYRF